MGPVVINRNWVQPPPNKVKQEEKKRRKGVPCRGPQPSRQNANLVSWRHHREKKIKVVKDLLHPVFETEKGLFKPKKRKSRGRHGVSSSSRQKLTKAKPNRTAPHSTEATPRVDAWAPHVIHLVWHPRRASWLRQGGPACHTRGVRRGARGC